MAFNTLMASLKRQKWNVHAEEPFKKSTHVISYLGRYTHRIGIANSRLVNVTDDSVTFWTKDGKTATLHPVVHPWLRFLFCWVHVPSQHLVSRRSAKN